MIGKRSHRVSAAEAGEHIAGYTTANDEPMQDRTTGTPGGAGHVRKPSVYLKAGDVVEVAIDDIGTLRNELMAPTP